GIGTVAGNEHTFFGTHVHYGCETVVNERRSPLDDVCARISDTGGGRSLASKDEWIRQLTEILTELPGWMDSTFPNWSPLFTEYRLFEPLDDAGHSDVKWKGFVDAAITLHVGKRQRKIVQIIDWKTVTRAWQPSKIRDFKVQAQLA